MSSLLSSKHKCTINFVNELHERYSCGICLHVADEPLSCGSKDGCTGVFCTKCLTRSLSIRKKCPLCIFNISGPPQKNNIIKEMIADEIIYCSLAQLAQPANPSKKAKTQSKPRSDCQWTGPLKDLDAHLARNCSFAPTPCTNHGCTLTPVRSKLARHLTHDCLFRTSPCPHCASLIRRGGLPEHLETCGKLLLTCADCGASYLRENQDKHDDVCPEALVDCPFECHGCTTVVLRKDYVQHQADNAVAHSELLAEELREVKEKLSDLTAIKDKAETISISWTIKHFSMHMASEADSDSEADTDIHSQDFVVRNLLGTSVLCLSIEITSTGILGVFLYKDIDKSTDKSTMCINGTTITLMHPIDPTSHITRKVNSNTALEGPEWTLGWAGFIKNIKPYISNTDSITFEGQIKCYPDTKATVIKL